MRSMNITMDAVSKSPLSRDTPIAVASKTETSILPDSKHFMPRMIYSNELYTEMICRIGAGTKSRFNPLRTTVMTSFSEYKWDSSRDDVLTSTASNCGMEKENFASMCITALRSFRYLITISPVRS